MRTYDTNDSTSRTDPGSIKAESRRLLDGLKRRKIEYCEAHGLPVPSFETAGDLVPTADACVLLLYLHVSPEHTVTVSDGRTDLKISMDGDFGIHAQDLAFPDRPPMDYSKKFDVPAMMRCIEQLHRQPPETPDTDCKSRWEEIKAATDFGTM